MRAYVDWCQNERHQTFPASVITICYFTDAQGKEKAASTIRRRLYAIRKAHRLLRLPDPTYDEEVNLTLRRVRRARLLRPKQAKGLTLDYLVRFVDNQPSSPWGLRNRAMLSLGYELLSRRSELAALRTEDVEFRSDGTAQILVRRSKSDPFGHGRIVFTSRQTAHCLQTWLDWRGANFVYLFCPIYQQRPIDRDLSTTTVKRIIKEAAIREGLPRSVVDEFSGHSMRVGAAQDLLCKGFDTAAIMRAGGWKSVNVLAQYLEKVQQNFWE